MQTTDRVVVVKAWLASLLLAVAASAQAPMPHQAQGSVKVVEAPEINPALIGGAAVLVAGGLLILTDRLRKRARQNPS